MKEILSQLHILKNMFVFYMYKATIVDRILSQVLWPENAEKYKFNYVILVFLSPDMKANIFYTTHYEMCKTKYCWVFYKLVVAHTPKATVQK